jgi:hypothetical protein
VTYNRALRLQKTLLSDSATGATASSSTQGQQRQQYESVCKLFTNLLDSPILKETLPPLESQVSGLLLS